LVGGWTRKEFKVLNKESKTDQAGGAVAEPLSQRKKKEEEGEISWGAKDEGIPKG